jgi:hypothetical protein
VDSESVAALLLRGGKDVTDNEQNEQINADEEPIAEDGTENPSDVPPEDVDLSAAAVLEQQAAIEDRAPYEHPKGARDYRVEGNDVRDYVGVDPEYMTYANPTEAPMLTDTERWDQTSQYDHLEGNADEDEELDDDKSPFERERDAADAERDNEDKDAVDQSSEETSPESQNIGFNPLI